MTGQPELHDPYLRELQAIFRADLKAAYPNGTPSPVELKRVLVATAKSLERPGQPRFVVEQDPNNPNGLLVFYRLDE